MTAGSSALRPLTVSLAVSTSLTLVKFAGGLMTHSMALTASALDSLLDVGSSLVNFAAAREAAKPPDREHEYGHEKVESLAALFQALLIMASALFLLGQSVRLFLGGTYVHEIGAGIGIMGLSITATFLLSRYLKKAAASSESRILQVEGLHYTMDLLGNLGVVLALFLVRSTGWTGWDLLISLFISGYILFRGSMILKTAVNELLDRSISPVQRRQIERLILGHSDKIRGIHNFRSRTAGGKMFLDFHLEISGEKDFVRAHGITESLIRKIQTRFPGADVTVHYDPEGEE